MIKADPPPDMPNVIDYQSIREIAAALEVGASVTREQVMNASTAVRADWNLSKLLVTPHREQLEQTLELAHRANRRSPTSRRAVAISGGPLTAKTTSALHAAIHLCRHQLIEDVETTLANGAVVQRVPIAYATPRNQGVPGLIASVAEFYGLVVPASWKSAHIIRLLQQAVRDHGTRFVVLDDLHGLRTQLTGDTITSLREVVGALNATTVLIGNGLASSGNALWAASNSRHDADQILGRTTWLQTGPFDGADKPAVAEWITYFTERIKDLYLMDGAYGRPELGTLCLELAVLSKRRYGAALDLLTETASRATGASERISREALREVAEDRKRTVSGDGD